MTSVTATVGVDSGGNSTLQYYNGSSWVSASEGVPLAAGEAAVLVRVPIVNDSAFEISESLTFTTGPFSGGEQALGILINRSGAYGTITIVDNGTVSEVFAANNTTGIPTIGTPDNDAPVNQPPSFTLCFERGGRWAR